MPVGAKGSCRPGVRLSIGLVDDGTSLQPIRKMNRIPRARAVVIATVAVALPAFGIRAQAPTVETVVVRAARMITTA